MWRLLSATVDCELSTVSFQLQSGVEDLHEDVAVEEALAPDVLEVGKRLGGHGILSGFASRLQLPDAVACGDEHVAEFDKFGFAAHRTVPGMILVESFARGRTLFAAAIMP